MVDLQRLLSAVADHREAGKPGRTIAGPVMQLDQRAGFFVLQHDHQLSGIPVGLHIIFLINRPLAGLRTQGARPVAIFQPLVVDIQVYLRRKKLPPAADRFRVQGKGGFRRQHPDMAHLPVKQSDTIGKAVALYPPDLSVKANHARFSPCRSVFRVFPPAPVSSEPDQARFC